MKVLLLNGSPRMKGNTRMALSLVMEGIEEGLHPESLELYDVSRHKLSACLACDGCKKNGGNCVQADESAELVQKIYEADVVVFGTPVYWWGMSAQLKMAVDKLYSRTALLQGQEAKKIGLITVGAAAVDDPEYQLIEDQMKCICGMGTGGAGEEDGDGRDFKGSLGNLRVRDLTKCVIWKMLFCTGKSSRGKSSPARFCR